jgi:putative hemolysin
MPARLLPSIWSVPISGPLARWALASRVGLHQGYGNADSQFSAEECREVIRKGFCDNWNKSTGFAVFLVERQCLFGVITNEENPMFRKVSFTFWIVLLIALSACSPQSSMPDANLPNPASVFCEQNGGSLEIRTATDGSQSGVCVFPDGSQCDEWAYFRGECKPGDYMNVESPTSEPVPKDTLTPSTPVFVLAPLPIQPSQVPLPYAVLVDTGDERGITAYDRSGLAVGEWQASSTNGQVHAAGSITEGIASVPLLFWSGDPEEPGVLRMIVNAGGNLTPLVTISDPVMLTGMVGLPASPLVVFSTLEYDQDGALIRSKVYLGDYHSLASVSPVLVIESHSSKYITPLAIRADQQNPVGIWFTYHLMGIGGTPGFCTNNFGLYYFDIASNTVHEFLSEDKTLNDLSVNQAYAAWTQSNAGDMQLADLVQGHAISFPMLPTSELSAGYGVVSPSGGYVAWAEGTDLELGEISQITVRVANSDGNILGEFPHASFAKASELGTESTIRPIGWLSDEVLLVSVEQLGKDGASAIVAVNVNAGEVTLFTRGEFKGFGYP